MSQPLSPRPLSKIDALRGASALEHITVIDRSSVGSQILIIELVRDNEDELRALLRYALTRLAGEI